METSANNIIVICDKSSAMIFTALAALAALAVSQVSAHGGVTSYKFGSTTYAGWQPYNTPTGQTSIERPYSSYNPITSVTDPTFSCNNNGAAGAMQLSATVPAGTVVTAYWTQWTHAVGPVMVYMAACPSGGCTSANSDSLSWFKIAETGLVSGNWPNGVWGTGQVMNSLSYTSTIPATLAPGAYMIRHELMAIHQANAPQFYPECAQLIITGSGTAKPPASAMVSFPGAYSMSDPMVNIDIYTEAAQTETTYTVPGPAVWSG